MSFLKKRIPCSDRPVPVNQYGFQLHARHAGVDQFFEETRQKHSVRRIAISIIGPESLIVARRARRWLGEPRERSIRASAMSQNVLEGEDEDMADENGEDKDSIQQILQGMTNEFNKSVGSNKSVENDHSQRSNGEEVTNQDVFEVRVNVDGKSAANSVNSTGKDLVENPVEEAKEEINETKEMKESQSTKDETSKKDESLKKDECLKKDGNIPRIVLTFRTIDENTDTGKKTKISSCSSNLTLVPDELVNCTQIGGVSVKIETSDENYETAEESKIEDEEEKEKHVEENDQRVNSGVLSLDDRSVVNKMEDRKNEETPVLEPAAEEDVTLNSQFIKKRRRRKLRVLRFVFCS